MQPIHLYFHQNFELIFLFTFNKVAFVVMAVQIVLPGLLLVTDGEMSGPGNVIPKLIAIQRDERILSLVSMWFVHFKAKNWTSLEQNLSSGISNRE